MSESIIFVDKNDAIIGSGTREEAWAKGIYVRIVRVILRDEKGRILSQLRSADKKSYPNCWTDSASGHVDKGETYDSAVLRELSEELGIEVDLRYIGKFATEDTTETKKICEFNAVYEAVVKSDIQLSLQAEEVSSVKWYALDDLKKKIHNEPNQFVYAFKELIMRYY